MAIGTKYSKPYFNGAWHDGNIPHQCLAAEFHAHGRLWLGSNCL